MTSSFTIQAISALPNGRTKINHYRLVRTFVLQCCVYGDSSDWLSSHALMRSLAYGDSSITSATVRREARRDSLLLGALRKTVKHDCDGDFLTCDPHLVKLLCGGSWDEVFNTGSLSD